MAEPVRFDQFRSHPWHGLTPGIDLPHIVQAYTEITPFDSVKLENYFSTYKMIPGHPATMVIREVYGVAHAQQVVGAAVEDYTARFGQPDAPA